MRSEVSVYRAKYALRRALDRAAFLARLDPNAISVAVLVPSALVAISLVFGWWIVAALGVLGRMFLSTLDGYVAETYGKKTRLGAYLNRAVAQVGDAIILVSLVARADPPWVALVIAGAWLADALAFLGALAGGTLQWGGPAAQADRLTVILAAALLALVLPIDWTIVCEILAALLVLTIAGRLWRAGRELAGS